jgi:tRNA pseudouridine38-40 synthase
VKPRREAPRKDLPKREGPAKGSYRLLLEYDGSRYAGWQKQSEAQGVRTVQGTLERVLQQAGMKVLSLGGSGRTDAGVHALGQVAHLHLLTATPPKPYDLQRLFDEGLPQDVALREVHSCNPNFHARHDAKARSYLYQISQRRTGLAKPYVWWVKQPMDIPKLHDAWMAFQGFHDVSAFADLEGENPKCEIQSCEFVQDGALILLRVTASHFLRKQVRRMVGAAVSAAIGKMRVDDVLRDLKEPRPGSELRWSERAAASSGLFLEHVRYEGDAGPGTLRPVALVL